MGDDVQSEGIEVDSGRARDIQVMTQDGCHGIGTEGVVGVGVDFDS